MCAYNPEKTGRTSNFTWRAAFRAALLFAVLSCGCSQQSNLPQETNTRRHALPEDRTLALARDNNCAVLPQEIRKSVGTNPVYSIDVQRVLDSNKRLTAICYLMDLAQVGEHSQAVFEVEDLELGAWSGTCVARLECPTTSSRLLPQKRFFRSGRSPLRLRRIGTTCISVKAQAIMIPWKCGVC